MKKTLYGTTAIVALGLAVVAATPASAQAPAQGFSSANFQFTIGGFGRGYVGGASQRDSLSSFPLNTAGTALATPTAQGATQRFDVQRDWQLNVTAGTNLPNGMRVTTAAQFQSLSVAQTSTFTESYIRRAWVSLAGGFGDLRVGSIDSVSQQMAQGAMDAFTAVSARTGKIYDFIQTPNVFGRDDTALGASNNTRLFDRSSEKVLWFSPRIQGFQIGANYTPEASKDKNSALATSAGGVLNRGWSVAGNYVNTFGGLGVRASVGYITWKAPINAANGGSDHDDPSALGIGLGVSYRGFDLGGGFGSYRDTPSAGRVDGGAAVASLTNRFIGDGIGYDIGLGYTMGRARVSLNWFSGKMEDIQAVAANGTRTTLANTGEDKLQTIALNGSYTLGPGVNLEASIFNTRATAPFSATSGLTRNEQKATGIVTGIILAF